MRRGRDLVRARPAVAVALGVAAIGCAVWLLAGVSGTDWAAQQARASFAARYPLTPVDLSWFSGVQPAAYSVLTPPLAALLGLRVVSVLAAGAAAALIAELLTRLGVRRPVPAALWAALACVANVISGRIAFAVGLALGAGALLAAGRPGRRVLAVGLACATTLASPLAGFFLVVIGVAWALSHRAALAVAAGAGVPLAATSLWLSEGGRMPIGWADTWKVSVATALVALVCRSRPVRLAALLLLLATAAALAVPSPLGVNVTRLGLLFAGAALLADAALPRPLLLGAVGVCAWWFGVGPAVELMHAGQPAREMATVRSLAQTLRSLGPLTGRVEVVPLHDHGESAVLLPLARGWFRQLDLRHAAPLYSDQLDATAYRRWLDANAVEYVALSSAPLDWSARHEVAVLAAAPSYLQLVRADSAWTLWRVRDATPIVEGLVDQAADRVVFRAGPGWTTVRVRWSRWLQVDHGCIRRDGGHTQVRLTAAATVTLSSSYLAPWSGSHCG